MGGARQRGECDREAVHRWSRCRGEGDPHDRTSALLAPEPQDTLKNPSFVSSGRVLLRSSRGGKIVRGAFPTRLPEPGPLTDTTRMTGPLAARSPGLPRLALLALI